MVSKRNIFGMWNENCRRLYRNAEIKLGFIYRVEYSLAGRGVVTSY